MSNLADRMRSNFQNRMAAGRQRSSGMGAGFFRSDLQGVQFWSVGDGEHEFDIVPYQVGENDPDVVKGINGAQVGDFSYVLEVYEHRDVGGVEGNSMLCLARTYGQPCPICLYKRKLQEEGGEEQLIKALTPSRYPRSIYNVLVYDNPQEENKGVQVFHTSHYIMEMYLLKLARNSRRDIEAGAPPETMFASPFAEQGGCSIRFTREGKGKNTKFLAHQLLPRNYDLSEETLQQAYCLDSLLHVPTFEEVHEAFYGEPYEGQAPIAEPPAPGGRGVAPRGTGGRASAPTAGRGTAGRSAAPPAARGRGPAPQQPDDSTQGELVCPDGGVFGQDTYNLAGCETCEIFNDCLAEYEAQGGGTDAGDGTDGGQGVQDNQGPVNTGGGRGAPAGNTGRGSAGAGRGAAPAGGRGGGGQPSGPAGGGRGGAPAGRGAVGRGGGGGRGAAPAGGRGAAPAAGAGRTLRR